jgi:hypothetical protein
MNRVTFIFTAISIAAALISCAGSQAQQANIANQSQPEQQGKSAEAIQQEQRGKAELESVCMQIRLEGIDCIIGEDESSDEGVAGDKSLFRARTRYAESLQSSVKTESERITGEVKKEAQVTYTQTATVKAEQTVSRAFPYATRTVYDGKYYKVYTLMVINPEDLKEIIEASAIATGNEEVIARVKSPEVQEGFLKKITAFKDVALPILKKIAVNIIR